MKNLSEGVLPYLEIKRRLCAQTPLEILVERTLSVMAVLGLTCLCIGLLVHIAGRALNDLNVARVGAYILVIGIVLVATRLFYWIMENIVLRGLESMTKKSIHVPLLEFHYRNFGRSSAFHHSLFHISHI